MSANALPTTAPLATAGRLSHRQVLVIFSGLLLGMLLGALDQTIVATALPTIVGDLGGLEHLSWVVTAYLLASTASTPLWGKLGDLYGRKRVYQTTIVLFLVGSALCGLSRTMWHLILFRGLQGLGGGGLIVTSQAIVADVVSPRERGRYQGIFGSVFGVTSVAGPLLGGFFVDHLSWRWVFYVNLPIGVVALVVTGLTLPALARHIQHRIDYAGTALLAAATTCAVLFTTFGGSVYPWASPPVVGLAVAAVVLGVLFVIVERRAAEPVLPLALFRRRVFALASAISFVVGFALLGTTTFLPLFLQVVQGVSPTLSGLRMVPLMAGLLVTSIGSGQLISRWGRYKLFPIVGLATMAVGLYLLSRMDAATSAVLTSAYMLVLGLGLGLVMQVLIIAVQNAVDYRDLGAATSGATFFRSIGSVFGVALFGAIFNNLLGANMQRFLPPGAAAPGAGLDVAATDPATLAQLPPAIHSGFVQAYAASLQPVFLAAVPFALLGFLLALALPEVPLRQTAGATDPGETFGMPQDRDSLDEIARALSVLAGREQLRPIYERLAARAGVDLPPGCCWLLFRLDEQAPATLAFLAKRARVPAAKLLPYLTQLRENGLVEVDDSARGEGPVCVALTPHGREVLDRLLAARREGLAQLLAGWAPERHAELAAALRQLALGLTADDRADQVIAA
ncbi:MAG TPA: MDR family MFS transporter [Chloroflexota bacterium]|nr:MDR family MFS transporter [Chloroflexota bacterium]